jgi:hypothetical protein
VFAIVPELGLYSSELFRYVQEFADGQVTPPAINTDPLSNNVALCWYRLVFSASVPVETVSVADPFTEPEEAEIVVVPPASAVASPVELMLDAVPLEELQLAVAVMSCVLPSE